MDIVDRLIAYAKIMDNGRKPDKKDLLREAAKEISNLRKTIDQVKAKLKY